MAEFFQMGGYAAYVWPAYIVTFVILIGMVVLTWRSYRKTQDLLSQLDDARKIKGDAP